MSQDAAPGEESLPPPPEGPMPVGTGRRQWARRDATDAEAKALASGLRLQILRLALHEPLTNQQVAERLGRHPASTLHHVRTLVATGFLVPQADRTGARGSREVPYLASGKSWYLTQHFTRDPAQPTAAPAMVQAFVAEMEGVPAADLDLNRMGLRLADHDLEDFRRRMHELLREYADRPADPAGTPWTVFVAMHPERALPVSAPARRARPRRR